MVPRDGANEDHVMEIALEAGAEDFKTDEHGFEILTEPAKFEAVHTALEQLTAQHPVGDWRVRLLVDRHGAARTECKPLEPARSEVSVVLAAAPIDSSCEALYYKTTAREVYAPHESPLPGIFDTLLFNERDEITEFTKGNVIAELDGQRFTPPVSCGLLPGVLRAEMLAQSHVRAERGATCYRTGRCRLPNSYLYDKEIIPRVQQYIRMDGRFDDTSVWILGERRLVTLMGCVKTKEQAQEMERTILLVDDVMGVVNYLTVGTQGKAKYEAAKP